MQGEKSLPDKALDSAGAILKVASSVVRQHFFGGVISRAIFHASSGMQTWLMPRPPTHQPEGGGNVQ